MNVEILTALAALVSPIIVLVGDWLRKLTTHNRATAQMRLADDLRQLGVTDVAENYDRKARETLLRPDVMQGRAAFGPFARADLWAVTIVLAMAAVTMFFPDSIVIQVMLLPLAVLAFTLLIRESLTIDGECSRRSREYSTEQARPQRTAGAWPLALLGAGLTMLVIRRSTR